MRSDLFWRMVSRKRELFRLLEFGKSNHDYTQLRKYCLIFCLNFLLNVKISDVNSWNNDLHWNQKEIQDKFLPEKMCFGIALLSKLYFYNPIWSVRVGVVIKQSLYNKVLFTYLLLSINNPSGLKTTVRVGQKIGEVIQRYG